MEYLSKTADIYGEQITGYTYIFEDDSELSLDLTGFILDYSGMGDRRAERLAEQLTK